MKNEQLTEWSTLHQNVLEWLRANDIDPAWIPADPCMTLVDDQLTTDRKVQNAKGWDQLDPANANSDHPSIARETATYTITVPPPPDVATWLLPRCPTCGR